MPVVCPGCGTLVEDGTRVCPACHHVLHKKPSIVDDDRKWCGSCGSPVPEGLDACPECGMPVEGAFDDDADERFGARLMMGTEASEEEEKASLASALPPTPKVGEIALLSGERSRRSRLFIFSALSALALVGGMTLFLTKPWGMSSSSSIQIRDDADTSMEGFPGERSHLVSQDRAKETDYQEEVAGQKARIDEIYQRMGVISSELDGSYAKMCEYLSDGQLKVIDDATSEILSISGEADQLYREIKEAELSEQDLKDTQERYVVLADYLRSASRVLTQAWQKADQMKNSPGALINVRAVLGGNGGYSYEEWVSLFKNAYGSKE